MCYHLSLISYTLPLPVLDTGVIIRLLTIERTDAIDKYLIGMLKNLIFKFAQQITCAIDLLCKFKKACYWKVPGYHIMKASINFLKSSLVSYQNTMSQATVEMRAVRGGRGKINRRAAAPPPAEIRWCVPLHFL